jgi:hypothetical protein
METHMKKGFFDPRRFGQLLLRDLAGGYRGVLIAMAAVAGTIIIISALTMLGVTMGSSVPYYGNPTFYGSFFVELLFIGGFIVTSLAFREARQNGSAIFYLTLPASPFEKLASKLLSTSVGFALGSLVFFTATAAASDGINRLIFGTGHGFFNPFDRTVLDAVGVYLLTQSLFLLGSVWFRKLALVKTVLWTSLIVIGIVVVAAVFARFVLAEHFVWDRVQAGGVRIGGWSLNWSDAFLKSRFGPGSGGYPGLMAFKTIGEVLCYAMAPVCWLAAYFRLKEVEA